MEEKARNETEEAMNRLVKEILKNRERGLSSLVCKFS